MSFSVGIVGLPNVGKSTLFTALTKKQVDASNYPFCTIAPNVGVVPVPDSRLERLAEVSGSERTVPTTIEFFDIAGLVKNAHQGEGLGNQFLSQIREVEAIVEVLRCFSNENVSHVSGAINPESDRETIDLELIFADLETIKKSLAKNEKRLRGNDSRAAELQPILEKVRVGLEAGQPVRQLGLDDKEKSFLSELNLLTAKPIIYVLNVDEDKIFQESDYLTISAKIEAELAALPAAEVREYLAELKLTESGLDKLIKKAYDTLDLITFFSSGPAETRAWTVKRGVSAPEAGGAIHSDFQEKFIKAEVINWRQLVEAGGEALARDSGLIRLEGRDYQIQDGDVINFKHG